MEVDQHGQELLGREECLRLLGSQAIGRVGVTISALPAIFPVNFAVLDGDVVFRTPVGSRLSAALQRAVVAFEADTVSWSVLVVGPASVLADEADVVRSQSLPLTLWTPPAGSPTHDIRIKAELVSGRRLSRVGSVSG